MGEYAGGGTSGTSWKGMTVDAIWELIKDHNSNPHREMGDAWDKSAQLLEKHIVQVRSYRDRLAEAWPPEKSKAAYAYLERLEQLLISLEETRVASKTNWRVLTSTIDAVEEAKEKVAGIQQEYATNRDKLEKFEKAKNETALATMDPLITTPPVPYSRQDDLTTQARLTMESLSAELAAAQSNFIAPKPYDPRVIAADNFDSTDTGGPGGLTTSAVPPFSPRSLTPTKSTRTTSPNSGVKNIEPSSGGEKPGTSKPAPDGPILGGKKTQPTPVTTIPPTNVNPTVPSNPNLTGPYTIAPTVPNTTTTGPRSPLINNPPVGTFPPTTGSRGTSLPHGGVIGGPPSGMIGGTPPPGRGGQLGASARGGQRVNPVGGLIGQDPGARPGRRTSSRNSDEPSSKRWDPDNPWETAEGTDPILLPTAEQRIDPGPSIGGR